jgi:hypothetical protein
MGLESGVPKHTNFDLINLGCLQSLSNDTIYRSSYCKISEEKEKEMSKKFLLDSNLKDRSTMRKLFKFGRSLQENFLSKKHSLAEPKI